MLLTLPRIECGGFLVPPSDLLVSIDSSTSSGQMSPSVSWLATGSRMPYGTFPQDVDCRILVSINDQSAARTDVGTDTQRLLELLYRIHCNPVR